MFSALQIGLPQVHLEKTPPTRVSIGVQTDVTVPCNLHIPADPEEEEPCTEDLTYEDDKNDPDYVPPTLDGDDDDDNVDDDHEEVVEIPT